MYTNALSKTHFFIEIYTSNSTRKWCEKKNLARNQRKRRNLFDFIFCAEILEKIYSLRLEHMIRESIKAWHQLELGFLISSKECDHSEINRTFCVHICVFVRVLHAPHYRISCENWQIACFFSSSLQYSITRMPFIAFAFNNIVSTYGIGQSEYVLSVLIWWIHSQSHHFDTRENPFRLITEFLFFYLYDSFASSSSKSKVNCE